VRLSHDPVRRVLTRADNEARGEHAIRNLQVIHDLLSLLAARGSLLAARGSRRSGSPEGLRYSVSVAPPP
jgi:hypothetical protein